MPEIREQNKKAGVSYALTDDGLELPVIDVTSPVFRLDLSDDDLRALLEEYMRNIDAPRRMMALFRRILFWAMSRRSVLMRGLMAAEGTFMSGMNTYMMKLGPDNLNAGFFSEMDRQVVSSAAGRYMRLRLQDVARMLSAALIGPLAARPGAALHLLDIGGGPAVDSLNALILIRRERPDLLAGRDITIHSLDLDTYGAHFGARALDSLLAEGAPLHGLSARFEHVGYNWSDQAQLRKLLASFGGECVAAASSEGALFEYGSDEDISGNLAALAEGAPPDAVMTGTVTRSDELGLRVNGRDIGSRAALQFREFDAFRALARAAGWETARSVDRPLSHAVLLERIGR